MKDLTPLNKDLVKLFDFLFKNNVRYFNKSEFKNLDELFLDEVIRENKDNSELLDINTNPLFFDSLLMYIELEMKKGIPKNISDSFRFIDDFDERKRENNEANVINAFDDILNTLKVHLLQQFEKSVDENPKEFLLSLDNRELRQKHLYKFERIFFEFLPYSNYSIEEIVDICIEVWNKEEARTSLIGFLRDLGTINIEKAKELYTILNKGDSPLRIISYLLIGNYNAGDFQALDFALNLRSIDLTESLFVLARINYMSEDDISEVFNVIEPLNFTCKDIADEQAYLLLHLIKNTKTPNEILQKCYTLLANFITNGTLEIVDSIFHTITYQLDNYESEKYNLLHKYLSKTQNFNIIKTFFFNFKDPQYLFDLIKYSFSAIPTFRFPVEIFRDGISHAWRESKEKTESLILDLFNQHPAFSILAVKIILSASYGIYEIDLLKLDKKESQINAIRSFCRSPINFDKLVLLLLPLRNSRFKDVVLFLQESLSSLVFHSYHETIYESILNVMSESITDKEFIKPIKEALDNYNKLRQLKESIKDIDPIENESDLMQLYYRLEREEQAKMMSKINKGGEGSLMHLFKNTIIVRGNSWKIGDREVSPLGKIESKMLVDGSSYLNPDLYESNLEYI